MWLNSLVVVAIAFVRGKEMRGKVREGKRAREIKIVFFRV
jgi:hypothetical protein